MIATFSSKGWPYSESLNPLNKLSLGGFVNAFTAQVTNFAKILIKNVHFQGSHLLFLRNRWNERHGEGLANLLRPHFEVKLMKFADVIGVI